MSKKRKISEVEETVINESPNKKIKSEKKSKKKKKEKSPKKKKSVSKDDTTNMVVESPVEEDPFAKFRISQETVEILKKRNINALFPIQEATFDQIYDNIDIMGRARTGTGKTLAFSLPVCEKIKANPRTSSFGRSPLVLVIAPTRELAKQIGEEFKSIAPGLVTLTVYGGVDIFSQQSKLKSGVDVIVGTPGRLIDHIERTTLKLDSIAHVILDEADEMLNIGFADDIEKILTVVPKTNNHQTLFFSATIPAWVSDIAKKFQNDTAKLIDLVGNTKLQTSEGVKHFALQCARSVRLSVLADVVKVYAPSGRKTIIFANTKSEANEIALNSTLSGDCQVLHGDIIQSQRELSLNAFREGKCNVLVATDVAARGLDIPEVDLIVQCQPPQDIESYVHRSGRTGRAGRQGTAIIFFTKQEEGAIKRIERTTQLKFERVGAPQATDIIRESAKTALSLMDEVHEDMIAKFLPEAEKVIEERGSKALAAAMAQLCGFVGPIKERSILSSLDGYTTVLMKTQRPVTSPSYVITILKDYLGDSIASVVKDIRFCDNGAVIDLPTENSNSVVRMKPNGNVNGFEIITELPELQPEKERFGGGGGGFNRRGGFGNRGGFGGNRGGGGFGGNRSGGGFGGNRNGFGGNRGGFGGNRGGGGFGGNRGGGNRGRGGFGRN